MGELVLSLSHIMKGGFGVLRMGELVLSLSQHSSVEHNTTLDHWFCFKGHRTWTFYHRHHNTQHCGGWVAYDR